MKQIFAMAIISLLSFSASAYQDGTYSCKNKNLKIPDNVYKVHTVNIGGISVPHIEATIYFSMNEGSSNPKIEVSRLQGFASVGSNNKGTDILMLLGLRLTFVNNDLDNCQR